MNAILTQSKQFTHNLLLNSSQQICPSYTQLSDKYAKLLKEFNAIKQQSISKYQKIIQEVQKSKSQNQTMVRKLEKKYQQLLHEEKQRSIKVKQKTQSQFQKQRLMYQQIISNKNISMQKLKQMLETSEKQMSEIVNQNTNNLIKIVKSQQNCLQSKKYSHTQLMKMYQFILEQNNILKKQLIQIQLNSEQQKGNQKTKRTHKNKSLILTQSSQVIQSKYISSGYLNQQKQKQVNPKNKEKQQNFLVNSSGIVSQNQSKNETNQKPKKKPNLLKKNKCNISNRINQTEIIIEQKNQKKKHQNKMYLLSQNTKKFK